MTKFTNCHGRRVRKRKFLILKPSSAAAKRVFSLLNFGFETQQEQTLQDYIQVSVMLRYYNR